MLLPINPCFGEPGQPEGFDGPRDYLPYLSEVSTTTLALNLGLTTAILSGYIPQIVKFSRKKSTFGVSGPTMHMAVLSLFFSFLGFWCDSFQRFMAFLQKPSVGYAGITNLLQSAATFGGFYCVCFLYICIQRREYRQVMQKKRLGAKLAAALLDTSAARASTEMEVFSKYAGGAGTDLHIPLPRIIQTAERAEGVATSVATGAPGASVQETISPIPHTQQLPHGDQPEPEERCDDTGMPSESGRARTPKVLLATSHRSRWRISGSHRHRRDRAARGVARGVARTSGPAPGSDGPSSDSAEQPTDSLAFQRLSFLIFCLENVVFACFFAAGTVVEVFYGACHRYHTVFLTVCTALSSSLCVAEWLPQIVRTFRLKTAGNVSTGMLAVQTPCTIAMIALSAVNGISWPALASSCLGGLQMAFLFCLALVFGGKCRKRLPHREAWQQRLQAERKPRYFEEEESLMPSDVRQGISKPHHDKASDRVEPCSERLNREECANSESAHQRFESTKVYNKRSSYLLTNPHEPVEKATDSRGDGNPGSTREAQELRREGADAAEGGMREGN